MVDQAVGFTHINVDGLKKMSRDIDRGLRSSLPGPMLDMRKQWAFRYRGFSRERFERFSKGGGDWPALKASTIARRRHGGKGRFKRGRKALAKAKQGGGGQVSILWDLGQLIGVLSAIFARLPGQLERAVPFGILVGFGGPARKKTRGGKTQKATIAEIASYHQEGKGNLRVRKILVDPSMTVQNAMAGDAERAIQKIINHSQVRPA